MPEELSDQQKKRGDVSQKVLCPPERFISVPTSDLQEAFRSAYSWTYMHAILVEDFSLGPEAWMSPGQFSEDDYWRFTDICKLFEANSRLDFITVTRYAACPQQVTILRNEHTCTGANLNVWHAGVFRTIFACSQRQPEVLYCQCAKAQVGSVFDFNTSCSCDTCDPSKLYPPQLMMQTEGCSSSLHFYVTALALQVFLVMKRLMQQSLGFWKTSVTCLQQRTTVF